MKSATADQIKPPRGRPFQPGNKQGRGRPRGSRNKTSALARALLEKNAERLVQKWIGLALKGDLVALKWCMERILVPPREPSIRINMPRLEGMQDIDRAQSQVLAQVGKGKIIPAQARAIHDMLQDQRDNIEGREVEAQFAELEKQASEVIAANRRRNGGFGS